MAKGRPWLTVHRDPETNLIIEITGWPPPGSTCPACGKGTMQYRYREGLVHDVVECDNCDEMYHTSKLKHLGPQKSLDYF